MGILRPDQRPNNLQKKEAAKKDPDKNVDLTDREVGKSISILWISQIR